MIDKDYSTQDYIDLLEKLKKSKDIGRIGAELGICGIGGIALSGLHQQLLFLQVQLRY